VKNTHHQFIQASLSNYVGLSYKEYDCYQLLVKIYKELLNIDLPDHIYQDPFNFTHISQVVNTNVPQYIEVQNPKPGDIILLRVFGVPSHLGIYINAHKFLHTTKQTGSVIERLDKWEKRILGYYTYDNSKA
jgi:cell wall-associated NlpC family hydrolase